MRQTYIELENSNIIPQNRKKIHKITEITTDVSRRYNSSSGTKGKHTGKDPGKRISLLRDYYTTQSGCSTTYSLAQF